MENEELKYPIKYGVLEIKEEGNWENGFVDITKGYIVSKCYVVESNTKYYADGKSKETYSVVFPYQDINVFMESIKNNDHVKNLGYKKIPRLNAMKEYYSVEKLDNIYDNYEDAKEMAEIKNNVLRNNPSFTGKTSIEMNEIINEVGRNLALCLLFEQAVLEQTKDMEVTNLESYNTK